MPIRVVIAEDSYLLREGVVRLLEAQDDVEVVGACGDFDELLATVDTELPDVVLTDIAPRTSCARSIPTSAS